MIRKHSIFAFLINVMQKYLATLLIGIMMLTAGELCAQCSICTKTAQQMGEKPAKALNGGILYLAAMPLAIMGFIAYKWWKGNGAEQ